MTGNLSSKFGEVYKVDDIFESIISIICRSDILAKMSWEYGKINGFSDSSCMQDLYSELNIMLF